MNIYKKYFAPLIMTPEEYKKLVESTGKDNPLRVGDLFQVDYYADGYERDRMIHTVLGLYIRHVELDDIHGVVLENPIRIVQEQSRQEKYNFPHPPFNKLTNFQYRNLETQIIPSPKPGLELVDLTSAAWIYYGSEVVSVGLIYYNGRIFGENLEEIREKLQEIRSAKGFTDSD
jgi:hypothetical protein